VSAHLGLDSSVEASGCDGVLAQAGLSDGLRQPSYRRPVNKTPQTLPPVTLSEHDGVRYLHLGSIWIQGAMRIKKPQHIELDYVQRMLASLLWLPTSALAQGHAVQLGLGGGAITRFTAGPLGMATTVVEINPDVVRANALFFGLPKTVEVVVGDAADWLAQATPGSVRLLHVDLYDHDAAAPVLDDVAFYAACREVLEEGGVFAVNLFGRHASFHDSIGRIAEAFGSDQVWSLRPTREGNTVVVAGRAVVVPSREALTARADVVAARFGELGLPAHKWLRMVKPFKISEQDQTA
jgi:spermidine synthase